MKAGIYNKSTGMDYYEQIYYNDSCIITIQDGERILFYTEYYVAMEHAGTFALKHLVEINEL